jgi:transposase
MFTLSTQHRFLLYSQPTDMRKSFDGLSGLVQNNLAANPRNGDVFIFINKGRDRIKLLHWSGSGYTLYYRRLESGTFELSTYDGGARGIKLDYARMVMILEGLSIKNISARKRYSDPKKPVKNMV